MKFKIQSQGILKKNIVLFVFTASFLLLIAVFVGKDSAIRMSQAILINSLENNNQNPSPTRNPANFIGNPYVIPTGTQMIIPPWIMEQYLLSEQAALYGDALNFLIHNYGVSAPSASDEDEDTFYIPLTRYKKKYDDYDFDYDTPEPDDYDDDDDDDDYQVVMVDVTSLTPTQPPPPQPRTITPQPEEATTPQPEATTPQPEATTPQPEATTPQPEATTPQPGTTTPPTGTTTPQPETTTPQPEEATTPQPEATTPQPEATTPQPGTTTSPATGTPPVTYTGPTFTTTEPTDTSKSPPVPEYKPEEDLSQPYTASCEKSDEDASQTEASLPCVDCALNLRKGKTNEFLSEVGATVNHFNKGKKFSALIKKFCQSCHKNYGVDIGDFMEYLERRAREKNVPPEIMLAIMLRESDGDCNAGGDGKKSLGLFQLNIKNSTCLKKCSSNSLSNVNAEQMRSVCEDGKHRDTYKHRDSDGICVARPDETSKICLNNPYCNFEESLNLLIDEKWGIGNKGNPEKPPLMITDEDNPDKTKLRNWTDMSDTERTKWRNAIIAYNGAGALKAAEKAILANEEQMKNALGMGREPFLNNWEIKRMFFIKHHLNIKAKFKKCDTKQYPDANTAAEVEEEKTKCKKIYNPENGMTNLVHNLAYVERIAGREKKGDFANSSICQWIQFRKNNENLSCD